jgi:MFS transporter, FSR family, fosmidomycin resistance protein
MATTGANLTTGPEAEAAGPDAATERRQLTRVLTISGGHAANDSFMGFLPPLLPVFIASLSLSKTEAGLLTVFTQGPSLLQPVVGYLADRSSLRYIVILAPAITATMMSLLGIASSYAAIALLLLMAGISSASFHAVASAMSGDLLRQGLGRSMSFWMIGGQLGSALGPLVVVTALKIAPLHNTPWLMVGGWLISLILYVQLRDLHLRPRQTGPMLSWRRALRGLGPVLLPLAGVVLARCFLDAALFTFLPTFLTEEGADLWVAGGSLTILELAGTVGVAASGSLSDRLGRRPVLWTCLLAAPLLTFVFLASDGWVQLPVLIALGLAHAAVTPVLMAVVMGSFPENRGLAAGTYMALSFASRPVAVVLIGVVADLSSLRVGFSASALTLLVALPLLFLLPAERLRGQQ